METAYTLNPEVKTATPALLKAAQIGVLKYENPALANLPDKDAILVMSFGTTYKETRAKTIEATVQDIQAAHFGVKIVTAFTSHIVIERIAKNEGINYPTPEQALQQLQAEGYTRIALVTLDVIPGIEYDYNRAVFHEYKTQFKKMTLATPLIYWQGQEEKPDDAAEFIKALFAELQPPAENCAVLIMAHGTPQPANAYYSVLQAKLEEMNYKNIFVYTVEGWPRLETVIPKLKKNKIQNILLVPMTLVAGDHANNDMAGEHKNILINAGFKVSADLRGLGENKFIRKLYVERADNAWNALQDK